MQSGSNSSNLLQINELLKRITNSQEEIQKLFGETDMQYTARKASKASQLLSDEAQNNSENWEEKLVIESIINDGIFDHQNLPPLYVPLPDFDMDSINPKPILNVTDFFDDPIEQKRAKRRQKTICALRNVSGVRSVEPDQSPQ